MSKFRIELAQNVLRMSLGMTCMFYLNVSILEVSKKKYSLVPKYIINFNNKYKWEYILCMYEESISNIAATYCYKMLKIYK